MSTRYEKKVQGKDLQAVLRVDEVQDSVLIAHGSSIVSGMAWLAILGDNVGALVLCP